MERAAKGVLGVVGFVGLAFATSAATAGSGSSIQVTAGHFKDVSWSMEVKRSSRPAGAKRLAASHPCLVMTTKRWISRYSYDRTRYRSCTTDGGRLGAADSPLIASSYQPGTRRRANSSFVGIMAAGAVRSVRLALGDGTSRTLGLKRLTREQAARSGLGRLAYIALVVRGPWCAERLTTLNRRGDVLWDSGSDSYDCPSNSIISR